MNLVKRNSFLSAAWLLPIMIVFLLLLLTCTVWAESQQKNSDELLSEIMDMHGDLVTNEQFLVQAKMLGAYLEAAKSSDEPNRVEIYTKVLNILRKIKASSTLSPVISEPNKAEAATPVKSPAKEKQEAPTKYIPGAALLEIFKTDSIDKVPDLVPVIRTLWKQNLACTWTWSGDPYDPEAQKKNPWYVPIRQTLDGQNMGGGEDGRPGLFLVPQRYAEIGPWNPYIARFSFYYEAKQSGKYGFNIIHGRNVCKLTVSGVDIAKAQINEPTSQGVCNIEKGFHRIEFWLVSKIEPTQYMGIGNRLEPHFQVTVLSPDASDAMLITKDMMLMKEDTSPPVPSLNPPSTQLAPPVREESSRREQRLVPRVDIRLLRKR